MSWIFDLILIILFAAIVLRGWHQGIMATLLRLMGWAVAAAVIMMFAESWAQGFYRTAVEPKAVSAVEAAIPAETISAMNSGADAVQSIQQVLDNLSGVLGGQVVDTGSAAAIESTLRQNSGDLARGIIQTVLEPVLISVIEGVISLVILSACLTVFRFLARISGRRRKGRGILGKVNQVLGGILGLLEALAVGYLYALALSLLATAVTADWISPQIINSTVLVSKLL